MGIKIAVQDKRAPSPSRKTGAHYHKEEALPRALWKENGKRTVKGSITRVNADANLMDVAVQGSSQFLTDIPIFSPYIGPAGFMGIYPEVGSLVVLMDSSFGLIPVAYAIPQPEFALQCELLSLYPKETADSIRELMRVRPAKYRRMRPGEGRMASSQGAELFLDEDVELLDSMDNGFRVRSGDGSVIATSQQNYMFANGVWRSAGPIQRNSLETKNFGENDSSYEATEVIHSDGNRSVYIGGRYQYNDLVYNEYRLEVEDSCVLSKPLNDVNEGVNPKPRLPKVSHIMGNMVGNNPNDAGTYGKFLAPAFTKGARGNGCLLFEAINPAGNGDTLGTRGVAWAYQIPDKGFFGQDKEGALHAYIGETKGDTPGISVSLVAKGGKKEEWGFVKEGGLSWDMYTKGGISWVVGKSTDNPAKSILSRSSVVRYLGGTYTEHGFSQEYDKDVLLDLDGNELDTIHQASYKKVVRVAGNSREEVVGDSEFIIGGSIVEEIQAGRSVSVGGSYSESVIGDRTISTTSSLSINAIRSIKVQTATRTEKIVKGSDSKTILLGDDETTIALGSQTLKVGVGNAKRTVTTGNIEDTIVAGSHKTTVALGNYDVSVTTGNIGVNTSIGTVTVGGTNVSIKGMVAVDINAPIVGIGDPITRSGVITFLSHKDYTTGAPLIPSLKVTAGL